MATIAVIGATGRTGRALVERALETGHHVTAIARRPEALGLRHARLTPRAADVLRPGDLAAALPGHDAVVSAIGSTGRGLTTVYSAGTAAVVEAMGACRRLVVVSSAGLETPPGAGPATRLAGRLLHHVMRHPYADMLRMERLLAGTDLDWTAVRPTGLTDAPATGRPRVSVGATERVGNRTSRAELAAYILDHLDDPATYRTAVAISS
ncbi:NAD(P)-dependent oxidoreductase [Nonomuraea roseoviolacea]|uniref:NADH-flavin reductase n=1 Tax=Nonomuraea roseoviolacea subsp. carminata TaxID=160689 RepID=A0ABT1K2R0_9ACTN|nr:NAD(P)H-binding protein [Nonomuraea roseoviolacea]MCP2348286.1 putative NADH-flavin reductase [Nonomuraea roseoviolacea subsp. carminata]